MRRVFVSHSSSDKRFVRRLAKELRTHQVTCWIDQLHIKVGQSIPSRIQEGIGRCEYFLIVVSRLAVRSGWVQTELDSAIFRVARDANRVILPVLLEDCELPAAIQHLKYADFRQSFKAGLNDVLRAFDVSADEIEFLDRSERIRRIESLMPTVTHRGETPEQIAALIDDESYLPVIEKYLDPTVDRRSMLNAVTTIGWLADPYMSSKYIASHSALSRLVELYEQLADVEVREQIARAIAIVDSASTLTFLLRVLQEAPPKIKAAILREWSGIIDSWNDRDAWIARFLKLLHRFTEMEQQQCLYFDEDMGEVDFRFWVFRCLGELKSLSSVRCIEEFLRTNDWPLATRAEAAAAHWRITGSKRYIKVLRLAKTRSITCCADTALHDIAQAQRRGRARSRKHQPS